MNDEKPLLHLDLFSGIGGFALAADRVWPGIKHTFCDNEPFAQEVLKKHWPEAQIYSDIRTLTSNAEQRRLQSGNEQSSTQETILPSQDAIPFLLTGGFPCQPFSQAGRRKGEEDDRFLWPEMCRVIGEFRPQWVIAENVRGLLTQGGGVVFERVCTDLEALGYEVQPIVIPAVAVGAPHRRDRVWFVANYIGKGLAERKQSKQKSASEENGTGLELGVTDPDAHGTDTIGSGLERKQSNEAARQPRLSDRARRDERPDWSKHWLEVATRLCRVDDGVSYWVDGRGKKRNSRNARLKALGNAIVPAVAEQIMIAIRDTCGTMDV